MKKVLAIALTLLLVAGLVACSGNKATDGNAADGNTVTTYEGELSAVIPALYEKNPVQLMLGDPMEVNYFDPWSVNSILGLEAEGLNDDSFVTDGNLAAEFGIKEAYYSEPMIGSQAYSLVVARVSDGTDIEAVKKAMFEGIDQSKWICVTADELRVVSSLDIVMLVMASSSLDGNLADAMVEAFKTVVGELSGETLSKTVAQ
ncbi:MAG: hypothetical protein ACI4GC_05210 [Acutalibacteraceae bacterium]